MLNLKNVVASIFTAQLAVVMAPAPGVQAPVAHFINDQGDLVTVDPPDATHQPIFVAMPVSSQAKAPVQQSGKTSVSNH